MFVNTSFPKGELQSKSIQNTSRFCGEKSGNDIIENNYALIPSFTFTMLFKY